jgi:uncharacterized protein (DUF2267 family)
MQREEFIGRVRYQARLASDADAERGCLATLETLGEWVPGGLAAAIAAQLPRELGDPLRRAGPGGEDRADGGTGWSGQADFISRVAARAGTGDDQAAAIAHAVVDALTAATEGGLMATVTDSLPADLREYVTPPPGQQAWERTGSWVGPVVGRGDS